MNKFYILYPTSGDDLARFRGGGRMIKILKENLGDEAIFINDLSKVTTNDTLLIPSFKPFDKPLLAKRLAKKQILLIYDVIPLKYPKHFPIGVRGKLNLWSNQRSFKYYDQIVTISQHSKTDIVRYLQIPEEKVEVIYPTVSKTFLNPKSKAQMSNQIKNTNFKIQNKENTKDLDFGNLNFFRILDFDIGNYCLYVGDVNWNKNLVNLARAIKLADVPCIFVGKQFASIENEDNKIFEASQSKKILLSQLTHPWQKEFKDFLKEIGDDKRFQFLGYKDDKELIKLYQQSRVNLLLSKDEGFGFSYLEAATISCPSILADTVVFHETSDNKGILFARPDNPSDIAEKIKQIFANQLLRQKLSLEAYQRSKYFNPEQFHKKFMALINKKPSD